MSHWLDVRVSPVKIETNEYGSFPEAMLGETMPSVDEGLLAADTKLTLEKAKSSHGAPNDSAFKAKKAGSEDPLHSMRMVSTPSMLPAVKDKSLKSSPAARMGLETLVEWLEPSIVQKSDDQVPTWPTEAHVMATFAPTNRPSPSRKQIESFDAEISAICVTKMSGTLSLMAEDYKLLTENS